MSTVNDYYCKNTFKIQYHQFHVLMALTAFKTFYHNLVEARITLL